MTKPPPPCPNPADPQSEADLTVALDSLLLDQEVALARAAAVLDRPGAGIGQRALAWGLQAAVALRKGDIDGARRLLESGEASLVAREPADASKPQRAVDWLQHVRGQLLHAQGRRAEAVDLLRDLHRRADERPLVDAYSSTAALGIVLSMQGDDIGALDLFYQALAQARRSGNESLLVNALNNLGSFQGDLLNLDDALPLLEECLAGALRLGSRRQLIFAAGNLVQSLCAAGQPERALALARAHLIGHIRGDDPPSLQRDEEIAQALLDNGHLDEAEAILAQREQVDAMTHEMSTTRVWLRARILLQRGQAADALALCRTRQAQLDRQAESGTLVVDRLHLLRVAAQAADRVGAHALACRLLEDAFATQERLQGRAAKSRHISLQISHRLQQAEWERDAARQMARRLEDLNASLQVQIAHNEQLQAQLRTQAIEDPLTGLYNRRHLMDAGAALLALMRRRGEALTVALIDLDHFKQVNDRCGHEVGDRALRAFAELARGAMRAEDLVCRYGGEEFVLLMPGMPAPGAQARLQELLACFRAARVPGMGADDPVLSFSAGVAQSDGAAQDLAGLLAQADAALYAAKQAGRARVRIAGSAMP